MPQNSDVKSTFDRDSVYGERYDKIGGFLILFTISFVLAPFLYIYLLYNYFSGGSQFSHLTAYYSSPWLIIEAILVCIGAILFFQRKKDFPMFMIVLYISYMTVITLLYSLPRIFPYSTFSDILVSPNDLFFNFFRVILLVPYLEGSKRVKATFVR
jgi:amino acid permease